MSISNDSSEQIQEPDSVSGKSGLEHPKWGVAGAIIAAAMALIGGQLVGLVLTAAYVVFSRDTSLDTALSMTESDMSLLFMSYLIAQLVTMAVVFVFIKLRQASWRDLGFRRFSPWQAAGLVLASFLGFLLVATIVAAALEMLVPGIDLTGEQDIGFLRASTGAELVLAAVALIILAPFAEETVFRGLLLPAFARWFGAVPAVAITSIVFGALHPPLSAMITIGIFALFLGGIYVRTRSIWPAILLHSLKNLVAYIGIFIIEVGI